MVRNRIWVLKAVKEFRLYRVFRFLLKLFLKDIGDHRSMRTVRFRFRYFQTPLTFLEGILPSNFWIIYSTVCRPIIANREAFLLRYFYFVLLINEDDYSQDRTGTFGFGACLLKRHVKKYYSALFIAFVRHSLKDVILTQIFFDCK
jgi:hypothetical protein